MSDEGITFELWTKGVGGEFGPDGRYHEFRIDEDGVHHHSPVETDDMGWYHLAFDMGHQHVCTTKAKREIDIGVANEYWELCDECGDWYCKVTFFHGPKCMRKG